MQISSVCILGGSGLVGGAIAAELAQRGVRVKVLTRSRPRAQPLTVFPTLEVAVADIHDVDALKRHFDGADGVINLVGILHETRRQSFAQCHVELPRKVAEACRATGVRHLLHMSALGASENGPSEYQRSKAAGEKAVSACAGATPFTIFRPSVIFGEKDRFLNLFAGLVRLFPVIPLAGARTRFQPIWVEDVARCFVAALGNPACFNQSYDLCGPKVYTLAELAQLVAKTLRIKRRVVALPAALANLQAAVFERLPGKLVTRDNLRSMSVDNVSPAPFPAAFGFQPAPLEAVLPEYLAATAARARYAAYRHNAGR